MKKALLIALAFASLLGTLMVGGIIYIGVVGPETWVVTGSQMPKHQLKIIRELKLVPEGERIQYFYSDALVNIRNGMYLVTDQRLVLYCQDWQQSKLEAAFTNIAKVEAQLTDAFLEDGTMQVTLKSGEEWTFPVSNEKGTGRKFYEYLEARIPKHK